MNIHKNEITTGILVLVTLGFFILVVIFLGMPGVLKPLNTYRIYFDNANGIRPGAPVLLAGREIGKVTDLQSPVRLEKRPAGHPDYEVSIEVQVAREAQIYYNTTVRLTQQGLMGQQVIDFSHGDATASLAVNHTEFVGERIPDISEAISKNIDHMLGPESDLALTIKNAKTFMESLNSSRIPQLINNTEEFTNILKREPWRLVWPSKSNTPEARVTPEKRKARSSQVK